MRTIARMELVVAILLGAAVATGQEVAAHAKITAEGKRLEKALDRMDVEHRWLSATAVKWRTGEPLEGAVADGKRHTHCSALVAATAADLGIYILRPPQHPSTLLANAQYDWLAGEGRKEGWVAVPSGHQAQQMANQGQFVVAVYKESDPTRSGHIAIVRPSAKSEAKIHEEGPQIIQAGMDNHVSTSLREGFKHHKAAFASGLIRFYAHAVPQNPKLSSERLTDRTAITNGF